MTDKKKYSAIKVGISRRLLIAQFTRNHDTAHFFHGSYMPAIELHDQTYTIKRKQEPIADSNQLFFLAKSPSFSTLISIWNISNKCLPLHNFLA
jgi:hypothetical protein